MIVSAEQGIRFERNFGGPPDFASRAPGRVNLIGEHTDYNQGLVLPCAIDRSTVSLAALRDDFTVRVHAWDLNERVEFSAKRPVLRGGWSDYVVAVYSALSERGIDLPGLDLALTSTLPMGSGLSSSAALGVSTVAVLDAAMDLGFSSREWAEVAHRAESHFVGVGCGILDPVASALGQRGHVLRIDCADKTVQPIEIRGAPWKLLIFHSGVTRRLAEGFYSDRVRECESALAAARRAGIAGPETSSLSELSLERLPELERVLEPVEFKRARHVMAENQRVDAVCKALREGRDDQLGSLLASGQASLRDDYEVSIPELDTLCTLANGCTGVLGSRLTGAGGGGCTLHLVRPDRLEDVREEVATGFEARFGQRPLNWAVSPADGARAERLRA